MVGSRSFGVNQIMYNRNGVVVVSDVSGDEGFGNGTYDIYENQLIATAAG